MVLHSMHYLVLIGYRLLGTAGNVNFVDLSTLHANLLQTISGETDGDCTRDVLRQLNTTELFGMLNGAQDKTVLAETRVCSFVVGES